MKSTASIPNQPITWLTAPVEGDRKESHIPVITTQERKWGRYETTCTYLLNDVFCISLRRIANITTKGNISMYFIKLMMRVFLRML